ncbi:hypothetical protein [Histidinibacterium lentulum]|uniref:Pilus assembly protein n=1 Tax=Histidinibacterium lentulum TaxID=2480588 RepID=A0A3N2QUT4_9RHOB|nr:hypothetical protein [Histidinibacterium lentulum]ROT98973.1 hypothetical protein EAT49_15205 [Histidinibacterium lentulum]
MTSTLKRLLKDDLGAVSVDWVVLTAAVVGLAMAAIIGPISGARDLAQSVGDALTEHAENSE